jgi:SAM-dependent methyltransferase
MGRRCAPGCVFREDMPPQVDLYDSAYSHYEADVYRQVRMATYGEDLGQTSWVTNAESREIPRMLGLSAGSYAFEVGCGSGRYALQVAETVGCRVLGVDVNEEGVRNGNALARAQGLSERVRFECCDASKTLPYEDNSFDAAFANDVMCHVPGRPEVLRELFRVLRPRGRFVFSDALVIGGPVTNQELVTRSSIGYYLFVPPRCNEALVEEAGLRLLEARDTTESAAEISLRWCKARADRRAELVAVEGEANFDGLQRFLACVHQLTSERRLLRYLYCAERLG